VRRAHGIVAAAAAAVALAGIGLGVAGGVDDDADEQATGPAAARARAAAAALVPGGTVTGLERDDEGGAAWEAEVRRTDGTVVEVRLGGDLRRVGPVAAEEDDD
jgi:hypothetical protein